MDLSATHPVRQVLRWQLATLDELAPDACSALQEMAEHGEALSLDTRRAGTCAHHPETMREITS